MKDFEGNDVLGLRPYGETAKIVVGRTCDCVEGFLSRVCYPACEEVGLWMRDKVRSWRLQNIISVLNKAEGKLDFIGGQLQLKANPRVAMAIIENSSLVDDATLQDWWAGLFASSCTDDGIDDQNLIFSDILKQLTSFEVKLLGYCCSNCMKKRYPNGLIVAGGKVNMTVEQIYAVTGVNDMFRIDRELDHLVAIGLFEKGFGHYSGFVAGRQQLVAEILPSALALNLYYKAKAVNVSQEIFWGEKLVDTQYDGNANFEI